MVLLFKQKLTARKNRFPFYSWIRLFFLCYLVLPQTQGAIVLYQQYVDPFLTQHEREIEDFITRSHERAKTLGLQYFYQAIDLIREKVLGLPPQTGAGAPAQQTGAAGYAQSFLSRFNMPAVGGGGANNQAPGNDWFSTISSAVGSLTSTDKSHEAQAQDLSASGNLLPREMASMPRAERAQYISNQRNMLDVLRTALAQEERNLGNDEGNDLGVPLRKNRSDNSFHHVNHEDTRDRSPAGGGWASGLFGQQGEQGGSTGVDLAARAMDEMTRSRGS